MTALKKCVNFEGTNDNEKEKRCQEGASKNVNGTFAPSVANASSCFAEENINIPVDMSHEISSNDRSIPSSLEGFSNFCKDKSVEKFQVGQIWALACYAGRQRYCQIKEIETSPSFTVRVAFLEALTVKRIFTPGCCGFFQVQNRLSSCTPSWLLHLVKVHHVGNNKYEIYPREGEIWALYNSRGRRKIGGSRIVQILNNIDDYYVTVSSLVQVTGFGLVFMAKRSQRSNAGVLNVSKSELHRFAYRIPAFQLTEEKDGLLRGCWVLDFFKVQGSEPRIYKGHRSLKIEVENDGDAHAQNLKGLVGAKVTQHKQVVAPLSNFYFSLAGLVREYLNVEVENVGDAHAQNLEGSLGAKVNQNKQDVAPLSNNYFSSTQPSEVVGSASGASAPKVIRSSIAALRGVSKEVLTKSATKVTGSNPTPPHSKRRKLLNAPSPPHSVEKEKDPTAEQEKLGASAKVKSSATTEEAYCSFLTSDLERIPVSWSLRNKMRTAIPTWLSDESIFPRINHSIMDGMDHMATNLGEMISGVALFNAQVEAISNSRAAAEAKIESLCSKLEVTEEALYSARNRAEAVEAERKKLQEERGIQEEKVRLAEEGAKLAESELEKQSSASAALESSLAKIKKEAVELYMESDEAAIERADNFVAGFEALRKRLKADHPEWDLSGFDVVSVLAEEEGADLGGDGGE